MLRRVPISAFLGSKNSTVSCGVRAARQVAALQTPSLLEGEIFHPALDFTKEKVREKDSTGIIGSNRSVNWQIETQPILPDRLVVGLESTSSLVLPVQQQQQQLDRKSIIKDPKKKIAGKKITTHYTASEQLDGK